VLEFYENSDETSEAIYSHLNQCLSNNNISKNNLIAFSGDNASVNYGKFHSVFQKFNYENKYIIKANCNCHVLHNTAKYAFNRLPFDVENFIIKIYSHFSISAKRLDSLKSCYEFCDKEFESLLRHVSTRWLTLYPAINRIIDNIIPVKAYFVGIGTDECPNIISDFVWSEESKGIAITELYLHFASHFLQLFYVNIKKLENNTTNSTNLYDIMCKLRLQLKNRLTYEFFGSKVKDNLAILSADDRNLFVKNCKEVYNRAIGYLETHFDFKESPFKLFSCLNLDKDLIYDDLLKITNSLNIDLNMDSLFDEIHTFNSLLNNLDINTKSSDTITKYCKILSNSNLKNLTKIIETVLCIPIGNSFVERVFSLMKRIWTDDRNQMNIDLVKTEICINTNFSMSCEEFREYIKDKKDILNSVKSAYKM
jgi:hypothetical protein